jgi:hypothetical protein
MGELYSWFVVKTGWLKSNVIISGNTRKLLGVLQAQMVNHRKYISTLKQSSAIITQKIY